MLGSRHLVLMVIYFAVTSIDWRCLRADKAVKAMNNSLVVLSRICSKVVWLVREEESLEFV